MARKKSKSVKPKKAGKTKTKPKKTQKAKGKKLKNKNSGENDAGIVIIDDDFTVNKEVELEERRAYLEEARSQEASD